MGFVSVYNAQNDFQLFPLQRYRVTQRTRRIAWWPFRNERLLAGICGNRFSRLWFIGNYNAINDFLEWINRITHKPEYVYIYIYITCESSLKIRNRIKYTFIMFSSCDFQCDYWKSIITFLIIERKYIFIYVWALYIFETW